MDHRINMRQPLPLTPLFPGLNLTYALKLLQIVFISLMWRCMKLVFDYMFDFTPPPIQL